MKEQSHCGIKIFAMHQRYVKFLCPGPIEYHLFIVSANDENNKREETLRTFDAFRNDEIVQNTNIETIHVIKNYVTPLCKPYEQHWCVLGQRQQ